jgi:hypothetical protein
MNIEFRVRQHTVRMMLTRRAPRSGAVNLSIQTDIVHHIQSTYSTATRCLAAKHHPNRALSHTEFYVHFQIILVNNFIFYAIALLVNLS